MSETPNPPSDPSPTNPPSVGEQAPSAASSATSSGMSQTLPYQSPSSPPVPDPADVEKNKVFALLSYLGILWLVPLLAAKDSPFAKYHANQGIVLSIAMFIAFFFMGIVYFIPFVGCLACFIEPVILLGWLAMMIVGIVNAANGKMKPLPLFPPISLIK